MMTKDDWDQYAEKYKKNVQKFTNMFAKGAFISVDIPKDKKNIKLLDIATGPGTLALYAALNIKGDVLGIDYSSSMIEQLKITAYEQNLKNLKAEVMDGMNLTLENNFYDYVFSIFGVTYFSDPLKGLKEIYKVLKQNGTIIIAAIKPSYLHEIIKETNQIYYGKQFSSTNLPFSTNKDMTEILKQAGFNEIRIIDFYDEIEVENIDDIILKDHPMYSDIKKRLGEIEFHKYMEILNKIIKDKYPTLPGKIFGSALYGIAIKK